jgi:hypothetical protein
VTGAVRTILDEHRVVDGQETAIIPGKVRSDCLLDPITKLGP